MSDRAALYTVAVHPRSKPAESRQLDDIDGSGTRLRAVLQAFLADFAESSSDGSRTVRSLSVAADGDDLFAILQHGQNGVAADIVGPAGDVRLRQTPADLQLVRSGCLFRLPAGASAGELAVHVSDGRGMKELLEQGLSARFHAQFPALVLTIGRSIEGGVLKEAVDQGRIAKVRLVRLEQPGGHATAATGKWVAPGTAARIQLDVTARAAGVHIKADLLQRYLGGDPAALGEIVSFGSLSFDQALVEVMLPDGTRRLFDIAHPGTARPVMRELPGVELDADGEPTAASLLSELKAAIAAATPV